MTDRKSKTGGVRRTSPVTLILLAVLAGVFTVQGCGTAGSSGQAPARNRPAANPNARIAGAEPSAEALANRVLAAIAAKDPEMLNSCRMTKDEFCTNVFPELPASKLPNVSCDFTWDQATLKSLSGFNEILRQHGGRNYHLISIKYSGGADAYRTYKVHNKPVAVVSDENGQEHELRLFGSILEMDGQFKLFSFVVD